MTDSVSVGFGSKPIIIKSQGYIEVTLISKTGKRKVLRGHNMLNRNLRNRPQNLQHTVASDFEPIRWCRFDVNDRYILGMCPNMQGYEANEGIQSLSKNGPLTVSCLLGSGGNSLTDQDTRLPLGMTIRGAAMCGAQATGQSYFGVLQSFSASLKNFKSGNFAQMQWSFAPGIASGTIDKIIIPATANRTAALATADETVGVYNLAVPMCTILRTAPRIYTSGNLPSAEQDALITLTAPHASFNGAGLTKIGGTLANKLATSMPVKLQNEPSIAINADYRSYDFLSCYRIPTTNTFPWEGERYLPISNTRYTGGLPFYSNVGTTSSSPYKLYVEGFYGGNPFQYTEVFPVQVYPTGPKLLFRYDPQTVYIIFAITRNTTKFCLAVDSSGGVTLIKKYENAIVNSNSGRAWYYCSPNDGTSLASWNPDACAIYCYSVYSGSNYCGMTTRTVTKDDVDTLWEDGGWNGATVTAANATTWRYGINVDWYNAKCFAESYQVEAAGASDSSCFPYNRSVPSGSSTVLFRSSHGTKSYPVYAIAAFTSATTSGLLDRHAIGLYRLGNPCPWVSGFNIPSITKDATDTLKVTYTLNFINDTIFEDLL